jgi:hypothetical protein
MQVAIDPIVETVVPPPYQKLVKALWLVGGALVAVAVAIFGAGVYWANLNSQVTNYIRMIDEDHIAIARLESTILSLKSNINLQFAKLQDLKNSRAFKNTATGNGSGFSPQVPPGRCEPDEMIVGLQPMQGGLDITFQCAKMPPLRLE